MPVLCCTVLATLLLLGQSPDSKEEKAAIERAKTVLVSLLDDRLPKITLEHFLAYESEGTEIHWEVNDCGEQSGNPDADRDRDFPMCVEADFDLHHRAVSVSIAIGTSRKGPSGHPALFYATITDQDGKPHPVQRLGDLPKELRRQLPRQIRDTSNPVRAASEFPKKGWKWGAPGLAAFARPGNPEETGIRGSTIFSG